jgi:protocatechuate 3,4-dioxygenase beta subunit
MKRLLALAVFIFSPLLFAGEQSPASAARPSSIAGTVIKQRGSEPLKKVLVQVIAENQKEGGNYTASTDADGHFHIDDVEPGRYRIFLERSGFIAVNNRGQRAEMNVFTIKAGQAVENVFFRMLPTAVISGRITDEDGDPMPDVRVIAQMKNPGRIKHESVATAATNDLGEYRLAGLFPGQYLIVAAPPPDFRDYEKTEKPAQPASSTDTQSVQGSAQGSAPPSGPQAETRYLTTYYPGTFDAAQASVLAVKAGDDMPVNLTLVPARTYRVRGMVTGVPARQKPSVELISKAGDSYRANASEIGPDGQFEVRGVAPGSYVLIARADSLLQSLSARQDINVVSGDVEGVKLTPQPSFTLSGHLRIEGARSEGTNAAREPIRYAVNLRPAALAEDSGVYVSQDFFGINASVDRLGNFEWKDVTPGDYIVQVFGGDGRNGFFLKSVQMGGRDVATGFMASRPSFVDLVVSNGSGTIEGTVVEREGEKDPGGEHPAPNATVEAVPEEKYRKLPDHFAMGATDQNGRFTIRGLAPGNYLLYAWQNVDESVYRDPDFLKSQEANGLAAKVEENSHQQVELKVSPAPAEWQ